MSDTTKATGAITVNGYEPVAYDKSGDGMDLTRIHVEETFGGDITGDGIATFLQAARAGLVVRLRSACRPLSCGSPPPTSSAAFVPSMPRWSSGHY